MTALILLGLPAAIAFQPTEHTHIGVEPQRTYHTHMERQARLKRTPAWQDFSAAVDGTWEVRFDEWTGLPFRAWGAGIDLGPVDEASQVESALRDLIATHPGVFGVDNTSLSLGAAEYVPATDMWLVRFDQVLPVSVDEVDLGEDGLGGVDGLGFDTIDGVPVYRSALELRVKMGKLIMFGSRVYPDAERIDLDPTLSADSAVSQAIAEGPAPEAQHIVEGAELTILPTMGETGLEYALTWQVRSRTGGAGDATLRNSDPLGIWVSFVDAKTGALLNVHNEVRFASGTMTATHDLRTVDGDTATSPLVDLEVSTSAGDTYTDDDGNWSSNGNDPEAKFTGRYFDVRNADGDRAEVSWEDGDFHWTDDDATIAEIDSYVFLSQVRAWSEIYADDVSITTSDMRSYVNIDSSCNAYFDGNVNFYQKGDGCNNTGRIADVNFHEWGHGFHYYNLVTGSWDGSMGEGVGDVVAFLQTGDSIIAPYFVTNGSGIRNVATNYVYPDDLVGEVHQDGLIFAGSVWDLWAELEDSYGADNAYDELNYIFVNGMKAGPDIPASYDEFVAADDDNGDLSDGTPNQCDLIDAFSQHGLGPNGSNGLLLVEHIRLDNQAADLDEYQLDGEVLNAAPDCVDVSVDGGQIYYTIDNGETWNEAALSDSGDGLAGAIPAAEPGSIVHYYLAADLDDGSTVTAPEGAYINPHSFYVGELTELYREGFEDDDGDYTHELVSGEETEGADDWMWGRPNGYADDPDFAPDGSRVWGNDLGGGNYNGEYQARKHNRLTSVPIAFDASAYETIIVQFQRWLNVEDSYYDQARVLIDGEVVWTNHGTSQSIGDEQHQDDSWALHTLEVPAEYWTDDGEIEISWEIESDGGLEFGGWNIDDVAVYGANPSQESSVGDDGDTGSADGDLDGAPTLSASTCSGCASGGQAPTGALFGLLLALGAVIRRRD